MNDLYEDLVIEGYDQLKLIGVGKSQHMSSLDNWVNGNDASVCADVSPYPIWSEWDADQRDLYLLNHDKQIVFHENITSGLNEDEVYSIIVELISDIPNNIILGDINEDGVVNVVDVVMIVNMILGEQIIQDSADMNQDGMVNVIDIVQLVSIILN